SLITQNKQNDLISNRSNDIHTIEVFEAFDRILPSWNAKDAYSYIEDFTVDATNGTKVFFQGIGCEIEALQLPPPTIRFKGINANDFSATGSDFSEYRLFISNIEEFGWTAGTNTASGSFASLPDGERINVQVRNASGDTANDYWVRPDNTISINKTKLDNDGDYANVAVDLDVLAYDNIIVNPTPTNGFNVTFRIYRNGTLRAIRPFPIANVEQVETFTFDLADLAINNGNFTIEALVNDNIGTELVASSDTYTEPMASGNLLLAPKIAYDHVSSTISNDPSPPSIAIPHRLHFDFLNGANPVSYLWEISTPTGFGDIETAPFQSITSVPEYATSIGVNTANLELVITDVVLLNILRLTVTDNLGNTAQSTALVSVDSDKVDIYIFQASWTLDASNVLTAVSDDTYSISIDGATFTTPALPATTTWYFDSDGDKVTDLTETTAVTNITNTYTTGTTTTYFSPEVGFGSQVFNLSQQSKVVVY
ncbi:MAG: hypothetical protein ACPG5B_16715, partial [Chitinophagales bacterium]